MTTILTCPKKVKVKLNNGKFDKIVKSELELENVPPTY